MIKLPKVTKSIGGGLTKLEKMHKVILGVTLVTSAALSGGLMNEVEANVPVIPAPTVEKGALLLTPAIQNADQAAYHTSHVSHASHYSSRY